MILSADMLVPAAVKAGMKVPEVPENFHEHKEDFPHFYAFCLVQLGKPVRHWGEHWRNAEVIAEIPAAEILALTVGDLIDRGFSY